jgi:putative membrane protein
MKLLSFAKGALAMFWLVALLNLLYPFAAPLGGWVNWAVQARAKQQQLA